VRVLDQNRDDTLLELVIREGRNRQIRRVAEQLGHPVRKLHRVTIGSIQLGKLSSGQYRELSESEIRYLKGQAQEGELRSVSGGGLKKQSLKLDTKIGVREKAARYD
jgi:16S rRNA U516 pseudouridylate synthase RsuA-like enzyme